MEKIDGGFEGRKRDKQGACITIAGSKRGSGGIYGDFFLKKKTIK